MEWRHRPRQGGQRHARQGTRQGARAGPLHRTELGVAAAELASTGVASLCPNLNPPRAGRRHAASFRGGVSGERVQRGAARRGGVPRRARVERADQRETAESAAGPAGPAGGEPSRARDADGKGRAAPAARGACVWNTWCVVVVHAWDTGSRVSHCLATVVILFVQRVSVTMAQKISTAAPQSTSRSTTTLYIDARYYTTNLSRAYAKRERSVSDSIGFTRPRVARSAHRSKIGPTRPTSCTFHSRRPRAVAPPPPQQHPGL